MPRPDLRTINVIHGVASRQDEDRRQTEISQLQKKEVLTVQCQPKMPRRDERYVISFSDKDSARVQHPHDDALVIIPLINENNVKRVLVDLGSSADVMYYNLFKKLGLNSEDLVPTDVPLVGFNAASVWPLGKITLPVTVGTITVPVEFIVVDVPSPYNAILGRA